MRYRELILAVAGVSVCGLPAAAQDVVDAGTVVPEGWPDQNLYVENAWSVDRLFGRDVMGPGGERIGDVEDVVMNDDGKVVALIAEVGGFWDIGDTHVSVPWDMVEIGQDGSVTIPVTQDTITDYDLFDSSGLPEGAEISAEVVEGVDDAELGVGLWRASELMSDYLRVVGDDATWVNFGYVSDLIVLDGAIDATIVSTTARYGPATYAYPYRGGTVDGYGMWRPAASTYDLPILESDATSLPEFDGDGM